MTSRRQISRAQSQVPALERMAAIKAQRMLLMSKNTKTATEPCHSTAVKRSAKSHHQGKPQKIPRIYDMAQENKENMFQPLCRSTPHGMKLNCPLTPLIKTEKKGLPWSSKKVLTSTREQPLDKSSVNIPCLPKFLTPKACGLLRKSKSKDKERSRNVKRLEQYFVTPERRLSKRYIGQPMSNNLAAKCQEIACCSPKVNSLDSKDNGGVLSAEPVPLSPTSRVESPQKSADSTNCYGDSVIAVIGGVPVRLSPSTADNTQCSARDPSNTLPPDSMLGDSMNNVTKMTLRDISHISQVSSPHEQASSANLSGAFHSTFNYPLHSTFNYPLHSSFNFSNIVPHPKKSCGKSTDQKSSKSRNCPSTPADHCDQEPELSSTFDDSKNCTEIDVDEYNKTFCESSYLSVEDDDTCMLLRTDPDGSGSPSVRGLKRQQAHTMLSSNQDHQPDSFFDIEPRIINLDLPEGSRMMNPSVLTTLPSCSEYEEYSRVKLNVTENLCFPSSAERSSQQSATSSRRRTRNRRNLNKNRDSSRQSSVYAKNCRSLSAQHNHHSGSVMDNVLVNYTSSSDVARSQRAARRRYRTRTAPQVSPSRSSSSDHDQGQGQDGDSAYDSTSNSGLITLNDNTGCARRIVTGSSDPAVNLSHERKRALARRMRHFSSSVNGSRLNNGRDDRSRRQKFTIKTLGHF